MTTGGRFYVARRGSCGTPAGLPVRVLGVYRRACGGVLIEAAAFGERPRAYLPRDLFPTPADAAGTLHERNER